MHPKSVEVLDRLGKLINLSRSEIVRDVIDQVAKKYERLLLKTEELRFKDDPLLKMAGFATGPNKDISRNVDEIYFLD